MESRSLSFSHLLSVFSFFLSHSFSLYFFVFIHFLVALSFSSIQERGEELSWKEEEADVEEKKERISLSLSLSLFERE